MFSGYVDVSDGVFSRSPLEGWDARYEISGAADARGDPLPYGFATVRFDGTEDTESVVRLAAERVIEGRVLGPDGAGLPDVDLSAFPAAASVTLPVATATTGPDGAFRLGRLGEGEVRIDAALPPPLLPSGEWTRKAGETGVTLHARAGIDVTLRVLDPSGRPVAGASASVLRAGQVPRPGGVPGDRTDAAGDARLRSLDPEGAYVLTVSPPFDRKDLRALRREDWKPADETVTLERGFTVAGAVRDGSGAPVRGFVLRRLPDGRLQPALGTMPDGTFTIGGLPEGPITLAAALRHDAPPGPEVTVDAGATGVILVIGDPPSGHE
jgi:hypothetical protein